MFSCGRRSFWKWSFSKTLTSRTWHNFSNIHIVITAALFYSVLSTVLVLFSYTRKRMARIFVFVSLYGFRPNHPNYPWIRPRIRDSELPIADHEIADITDIADIAHIANIGDIRQKSPISQNYSNMRYLWYLQWGLILPGWIFSCNLDICNFCGTDLQYLRYLQYLHWGFFQSEFPQ